MPSSTELESFIASSFRSVWALELVLLLRREGRACSTEELVSLTQSSLVAVVNALDSLVAAGLATCEKGTATYRPVSAAVDKLVEETEQLYRSSPNRVRRLIVAAANKGLTAFSDAFRLKD